MINNNNLKEFWELLKEWNCDPITKHTADDLIAWIDDFVENPGATLEDLKEMNNEFEKECEDEDD